MIMLHEPQLDLKKALDVDVAACASPFLTWITIHAGRRKLDKFPRLLMIEAVKHIIQN
jgi:hypothetical protein